VMRSETAALLTLEKKLAAKSVEKIAFTSRMEAPGEIRILLVL
jgi:hypothetical protein